MYKSGDRLRVAPLQDVTKSFRSNVSKPYDVTVISDDENELVTFMMGGDKRVFRKDSMEWKLAHSKRFTKI